MPKITIERTSTGRWKAVLPWEPDESMREYADTLSAVVRQIANQIKAAEELEADAAERAAEEGVG